MMGLFGGQGFDPMFLAAHFCGGGLVLGAFFMATDPVTSPMTRTGQLIYGALIEAVASENGARMQAMDSATSNAEDMISV